MQNNTKKFSKILELLFDSNVHLGHTASRWNPKMAQYLLANYDNLHLIDLERTVPLIKRAISVLDHIYQKGNNILVIGNTKDNHIFTSDIIKRKRVYGVSGKWIGGSLTNWEPRNFSYTAANLEPPKLMVLLNTNNNSTAIKEAQEKRIPIIAILDSNSDPKDITYPIPGNDDSPKAHYLYFKLIANTLDK